MLWLLLLAMIPTGVIVIFVQQQVNQTIRKNELNAVLREAQIFSEMESKHPDLFTDFTQYFNSTEKQIFTLSWDRIYLNHSDPQKTGKLAQNDFSPEQVDTILGGMEGVIYNDPRGEIIAYAPVKGQKAAVVIISDSHPMVTSLNQLTNSIYQQLIVTFLMTTLVSGLVILAFINPLHQLAVYADQLGAGNLEITIPVEEYEGEIALLGDRLNHMAIRLRDSISSLEERITNLKEAEEEIKTLNAKLEERVEERTQQLEMTNKELESFSYSVSHDLRSPLRAIDGWSSLLLEDYGGQLDSQAQQYLIRVHSETQRMGHLIDGLLQLSRLMRFDVQLKTVDLSAIVQNITLRLQEAEPQRQVEFVIQPNLSATGDSNLLEIALSNLLGNAFKFTGKMPFARIEFGQIDTARGVAFFVRDNGAGFDMTYAQKLFGTFQRLHKTAEFPGTGIGLATVQRIIRRHNGQIWAEAEVDQGATFYFTLY